MNVTIVIGNVMRELVMFPKRQAEEVVSNCAVVVAFVMDPTDVDSKQITFLNVAYSQHKDAIMKQLYKLSM